MSGEGGEILDAFSCNCIGDPLKKHPLHDDAPTEKNASASPGYTKSKKDVCPKEARATKRLTRRCELGIVKNLLKQVETKGSLTRNSRTGQRASLEFRAKTTNLNAYGLPSVDSCCGLYAKIRI